MFSGVERIRDFWERNMILSAPFTSVGTNGFYSEKAPFGCKNWSISINIYLFRLGTFILWQLRPWKYRKQRRDPLQNAPGQLDRSSNRDQYEATSSPNSARFQCLYFQAHVNTFLCIGILNRHSMLTKKKSTIEIHPKQQPSHLKNNNLPLLENTISSYWLYR